MPRRRRTNKLPAGHQAPPPAPPPQLLDQAPLLVRLERQVKAEFRPAMRARLEELIAAEQASLRGTAPRCEQCGGGMKGRGQKPCSLTSEFGPVPVRPSLYRCGPCGRQVRPLWKVLGVDRGRLTGGLARLVALLGVIVPYELAAQLAQELLGVSICAMTVWREVQRLGAACEAYQQQAMRYYNDPQRQTAPAGGPAGEPPPQAVVLAPDGSMLGMQVRKTRRRPVPGQPLPPLPKVEEGHFREVKTGVLLLPTERLEPSPGRKSVVRRVLVSCLGHADELFERLSAKLVELNWLGPQTVVVVVGDGAEWIWKRAQLFANRCEILDFWHALQKAWEFARCQYGLESPAAQRFIHHLAQELRQGGIREVLVRLGRLAPTSTEAGEKLAALVSYYTDNQSRMQYDEYLRRGYGIGSGAVESAHKQVVHARLRQAGMRFSDKGAQHLLALRVLLLNGHWSLLDRLSR